jgi:ribosomal protein S18 acetylase RimI-like enzyme
MNQGEKHYPTGINADEPTWESVEQETREIIKSQGVAALAVNDLKPEDLDRITWSGSPSHIKSVARALERVESGKVEYLAVRAPNGWPVAKGGIDYMVHKGAGTLWQLETDESLRGLGIGKRLIEEAEKRIKKRGLKEAVMGVEDNNPAARRLYERLGYKEYGHEQESWEQEDNAGNSYTYVTPVTLLRKELPE